MLKKLLTGLVAGTMLLSMTSCGNLIQVKGTENTDVETAETELPGIGDTQADDQMEFTVNGVQAFAWNDRYFLVVDMTYVNLSSDVATVKPSFFYAFTDNEECVIRTYDNLKTNSLSKSTNPLDYVINPNLIYTETKIQPNRTENGYLVYEYYRPFSQLEIQVGNIHVFVNADEIEVCDVMGMIMAETSETTVEETTTETTVETTAAPTETTQAPVPSETTLADQVAPVEPVVDGDYDGE